MSQALTQQPAALSGMRRIPIPLDSYQHLSTPLSFKRLLNMYAEQQPSDARTAAALLPTPGLTWTGDLFGGGPILALNADYGPIVYGVSGTHFYRLTSAYPGGTTITDLGDIGTPTGSDYSFNLLPTIAVGVNGAVVCVPPNAFTCTHTGLLNQIGGTFPGANSVTYLDGYFVFTSSNLDAQFFSSLLLDPTMYNALDFANADGVPNLLRRVMTLNGELWLCGLDGLEVWYDAGAGDFPFRRRPGAIIKHGVWSLKTIAEVDSSLFWLGTEGSVFRTRGYQAERISTHAIEAILRPISGNDPLAAFSYMQDGHAFYCLSAAGRTFVYDCATGLWHERSSGADGTGAWMVTAAARAGTQPLLGTSQSGKLFFVSPGSGLEDGAPAFRQVILPPLWGGTRHAFCSRLELEMEVGGPHPNTDLRLAWSDDGGQTFNVPRQLGSPSASGRHRVVTTRLGSFRARIFSIQTTCMLTLYAIDADITGGVS